MTDKRARSHASGLWNVEITAETSGIAARTMTAGRGARDLR